MGVLDRLGFFDAVILYTWYIFCICFVYILVYFAKFVNSNPPRANPPFLPIRSMILAEPIEFKTQNARSLQAATVQCLIFHLPRWTTPCGCINLLSADGKCAVSVLSAPFRRQVQIAKLYLSINAKEWWWSASFGDTPRCVETQTLNRVATCNPWCKALYHPLQRGIS